MSDTTSDWARRVPVVDIEVRYPALYRDPHDAGWSPDPAPTYEDGVWYPLCDHGYSVRQSCPYCKGQASA